MEIMSKLQAWFISISGAVGAFIVQLFGGWTTDLQTLLTFMAIDFAMGLIIAAVFKKSPKTESGTLSSAACFKGLCKKGVMLLFVLIGYRLDMSLKVDYIRSAVIIGFIANELISIVEKSGIMGIPLPEIVKKSIELLKNKGDTNAH